MSGEVGSDPRPEGPARRPTALTVDEIETLLLGDSASLGRREVAAQAQVSRATARRFWHAMGFQTAEDDEAPIFTPADLRALSQASALVRDGVLDEDLAFALTRSFARSADRLAVWQTQLIAEWLTPAGEEAGLDEIDARAVPQEQVAEDAAAMLARIVDEIEPLLTYVWRRHLSGALARMLADSRHDEEADSSAPLRVIGFADLVNFTSLVRRMTERQLAALVQHFELVASNVVTTHGGRVIKTVGDEILFVHSDPAAGAAIGLDLVDAMIHDEVLPDIRVGMAWGKAVSRLGDVFGTTVNRASRLTSVTPNGRVWVDDDLAKRLGTVSGFVVTPQRRRTLRGIGSVGPSELSRSGGARRGGPTPWTP